LNPARSSHHPGDHVEVDGGGLQVGRVAADHILASRLKRLEAAALLRRERYSSRPVRYEYFLTGAGQELLPILLSLREWGERQQHPDADPLNPVWHDCGAELHVETVCRACREVVRPQELRYRDGGG
jgi:HxlR-like helix-turn-helix protein